MMTAHRIDWLLVSMHLPGFIAPQWLSGRRRQPGLSGRSRACNCKEGDPCDSTISGSWSLGVRHRRFVTVGTPGLAGRLLRIPDGDGIAAALRRRSDRPPKATAADTDRGGPWLVTKPWSSMAAAPLSTVGRGRWSGDPWPVDPTPRRRHRWACRAAYVPPARLVPSRALHDGAPDRRVQNHTDSGTMRASPPAQASGEGSGLPIRLLCRRI